MRCLNKNKVKFWYALYKNRVPTKDDQGRLNLSRRDALIEIEGAVPENDISDDERRPRPQGNRGGRFNKRK